MSVERLTLPGINIQSPWAELLLTGLKRIETRKYPLPQKHDAEWMWLIETPGKLKHFKARVVGIIQFAETFEYKNIEQGRADD